MKQATLAGLLRLRAGSTGVSGHDVTRPGIGRMTEKLRVNLQTAIEDREGQLRRIVNQHTPGFHQLPNVHAINHTETQYLGNVPGQSAHGLVVG